MGDIKKRNRKLPPQAMVDGGKPQTTEFFEQIVRQEVKKALRGEQADHRKSHKTD